MAIPLRKKTGTHEQLIRMVLLLIGLAQTVFVGPLRAEETSNGPPKNRAADWVSVSILSQVGAPLVKKGDPGTERVKHGFETGCVLKLNGAYHWFTAEFLTDPMWVKTRLAHWSSRDGKVWKRLGTLYESSGNFDGGDRRAALFGPMPIYNEKGGHWDLFYSSSRCRPNTITKWLNNYEMRIWRAASQTPGRDGFGGPYRDVGIILEPGKESDKWEGLQGVDSFFPYRVGDRWYAFYGSARHGVAVEVLVGRLGGGRGTCPAHGAGCPSSAR